MKLLSSILFIPVATSWLIGRAAACRDGPILRQSTIVHNGKEIDVVTRACTGSANATISDIEKRQVPECGICFHFYCDDSGTQPIFPDCKAVAGALHEQGGSFVAEARSSLQISHGTCAYSFLNDGLTSFNFTYDGFGSAGFDTAYHCFEPFESDGTAGSADCLPSQGGACTWYLSVFNPLSS